MRQQLLPITFFAAVILSGGLLSAGDSTTQPAAFDWSQIDSALGVSGEVKDNVYTITLPRKDLYVSIDGMDVPSAAGIESVFHFYRCECGKMSVVGQFCCAEYETNDVVDAIRSGAAITVAGIGPMLVNDHPRITIVRFQGEGDAESLAKILRSGLGWMGEARSATRPAR